MLGSLSIWTPCLRSWRRSSGLVLALSLWMSAAEQPPAGVVWKELPASVRLEPSGPVSEAAGVLGYLQNPDKTPAKLAFSLELAPDAADEASYTISSPATQLRAGEGALIPLRITRTFSERNGFRGELSNLSRTRTGYVVVQTEKGPPIPKAITIATAGSPVLAWYLVVPPLGLALVLVCIAALRSVSDRPWSKPMELPAYRFSKSWAANTTFAGTLLTGLAGLVGTPAASSHLSKAAYASLGVIFAAILAMGPLAANVIRKRVEKPDPNDAQAGFSFRAYYACYLVAATLMFWGLYGQLATIAMLVDELRVSSVLPEGAVLCFLALMGAVAAGFFLYGVRAIRDETRIVAPPAGGNEANLPEEPPRRWTMF